MKGFAIKPKKTPFQRHKELEEEKKRKADEEAAKVYEEFVESFKAEEDREDTEIKAFIHGGVAMPGSRTEEAGRKAGAKYVPSFMPPPMAAPPESAHSRPPLGSPGRPPRAEAFRDAEDEEDESVFQLPSRKADKDKPKNIDKMLDMLKKEQEMRDERDRLRREGKPLPPEHLTDPSGSMGAFPGDRGSFDDGDPFTTNLYVGNLHPDIHEANLAREFGRFGPIASVKIMWPRDEDQRRRGRNCGFVAFMNRQDAEAALASMNNLVLNGYEMKIGWGKAVPLPPVPLYAGTGAATGPLTAVVPPSSKRGEGAAAMAGYVPPVGYFARESTQARKQVAGVGADIEVKLPDDPRMRFLIDSMALYVLRDGCEFEQLMMLEQQGNPEYTFLFDLESPLHTYYRWRLYSLAEGDTLRTWRIDPFQMVQGGQAWLPPPMLALEMAAAANSKAATHDRALSELQRDRLEDLLRGLSAERESICEAMVFALDNADAAGDVVEVLAEALTLTETPPPTKLARLFLVNDILHNSTAPVRNASRYRARLEAVLPEVFESFQLTYRQADSRRVQEALRRHVLRVLRVWRERFIFPDDFLNGLQAAFLRPALITLLAASGEGCNAKSEEGVKAEEGVGESAEAADGAVKASPGQAALLRALEALPEEELLRKARMNGLSVNGGRSAVLHRMLALDEYLSSEGGGGGLANSMGLNLQAAAAAAGAAAAGDGSAGAARAGSGRLPGGAWQQQQQQPSAGNGAGSGLGVVNLAPGMAGLWADGASSDEDAPVDAAAAGGVLVKPELTGQPGTPGGGLLGPAGTPGRMAIKLEGDVSALSLPAAALPPAAAPPAPTSRWEEVDEEEEKAAVPSMPISKWLAQEEAARQQAAADAAAAAAAAARQQEAQQQAAAHAAATAAAARAAVDAAGGVPTPSGRRQEEPVMDEERRKRLREVELQVLLRQEQLQEEGTHSADAIEAATTQLRSQLMAQLEVDLAAAAEAARDAAGPSGRGTAAGGGGDGRHSSARGGAGGSSKRNRSRSRSVDRSRRRSSSRERHKDRDRGGGGGGGGRDEERRREEPGSSRGREGRDAHKELDRDKEKDRDRDRDKDRRRGESDGRGSEQRDSRPRDKEGDKDRDRDRDKQAAAGGNSSRRKRSRSRSRSKDRGRSRSREREKEKHSSRGGGRTSRSSRSRSRERRSSRDREPVWRGHGSSSRRNSRSRSRSRSRGRGGRDKDKGSSKGDLKRQRS